MKNDKKLILIADDEKEIRDVVGLLASHRKKIYSLDNIYESIWNENAVGNDAIMVHIKNIRKKLGDDSRNPAYIKTAWGRGYYID